MLRFMSLRLRCLWGTPMAKFVFVIFYAVNYWQQRQTGTEPKHILSWT